MMDRSARFAAVWLLGIGLLIVCLSLYGFVSSRWACGESGSSFGCDLSNIAVAIGATVAAVHLIVGASVWRGRRWGLAAGAIVATLALIGSLLLLESGPWWLLLPVAAGNLTVALALAQALTDQSPNRGM